MSKILITDDDTSILELIKINLELMGHEVICAENAMKSYALLLQEKPDLVILDVMMPGKSGYETCEEIRRFSYVPILFLTAKSKENDKLLGFHAGGDDYLVKPFSSA